MLCQELRKYKFYPNLSNIYLSSIFECLYSFQGLLPLVTGDILQTCDRWHVIDDMWQGTPDKWQLAKKEYLVYPVSGLKHARYIYLYKLQSLLGQNWKI